MVIIDNRSLISICNKIISRIWRILLKCNATVDLIITLWNFRRTRFFLSDIYHSTRSYFHIIYYNVLSRKTVWIPVTIKSMFTLSSLLKWWYDSLCIIYNYFVYCFHLRSSSSHESWQTWHFVHNWIKQDTNILGSFLYFWYLLLVSNIIASWPQLSFVFNFSIKN